MTTKMRTKSPYSEEQLIERNLIDFDVDLRSKLHKSYVDILDKLLEAVRAGGEAIISTPIPVVRLLGGRYRVITPDEDIREPSDAYTSQIQLEVARVAGFSKISCIVADSAQLKEFITDRASIIAEKLRNAIAVTSKIELLLIAEILFVPKHKLGWTNKQVAGALGWGENDKGAMRVSRYLSLLNAPLPTLLAMQEGFITGIATANLMRALPLEVQQEVLDRARTNNVLPSETPGGDPVIIPLVRSDFDRIRKEVPAQRQRAGGDEVDADTKFWLEAAWEFESEAERNARPRKTVAEVHEAFAIEAEKAGLTFRQAEQLVMRSFTDSPGMLKLLVEDAAVDNFTLTDTLTSLFEHYSELT